MYKSLALLALLALLIPLHWLTLDNEEHLTRETTNETDDDLWNILALTWPPGYCWGGYYDICPQDMQQKWKKKVMTVHGLWPQNSIYQQETTNLNYDELFYPIQLNDLHTYWPSYQGQDFSFYDHEYSKHGSIYVRQYERKGEQNSTFLKKSYFLHTVAKAESLSITFNPNGVVIYSKRELANLLPEGITEQNFYPICKWNPFEFSYNILFQIRICYQFAKQPGQERIIKCPDEIKCMYPLYIRRY